MHVIKQRDMGLIFSYAGNEIEEMTEKEQIRKTKKDLTAFLIALQREAENHKNWAYELTACPSIKNGRTLKKGERLHIHVCLRACPASSIRNFINEYWKDRHGIVLMLENDLYDLQGFRNNYMIPQSMYTWSRTMRPELLELHGKTLEYLQSSILECT